MKKEWIAPIVAGLIGAAVWPAAAGVVVAMDEGRIELPPAIEELITGVWLVWSMPGAIVEGKGYLTLVVITLFWALCVHRLSCCSALYGAAVTASPTDFTKVWPYGGERTLLTDRHVAGQCATSAVAYAECKS